MKRSTTSWEARRRAGQIRHLLRPLAALSSVGMSGKRDQAPKDDEDRVAIPLNPEDALRALLQVDPESGPVDERPTGAPARTKRQEADR